MMGFRIVPISPSLKANQLERRVSSSPGSNSILHMPWILDILQHAFAFERAVVTRYTFATVFLPALFGCYAMAVLVQLPRTSLYRVSLLPIVYWLAIRASMSLDFTWNKPGYDQYNEGLAIFMFTIAMRCTAWAFTKKTYTRLPLRELGTTKIKGYDGNPPVEREVSLPVVMWNACDLLMNNRGIGWVGPSEMCIPTPYFQVESRVTFFFLSLGRVMLYMIPFDILGMFVRSFGPDTFATPKGGTIFDPSLPPLQRYINSTLITLGTGFSAYFVIDAVYHLHAAVFTLLFQQYPSQWPPLFDSPLLSTSLTSFWGYKWHQLFRHPFVEIGSKPMQKYFGRVGTVMGAFAVSAILHDIGMRGMRRGTDTPEVAGFFLLHGVGVIMEYAWKKATGKRVGGIIGFLWVYLFFILTGNFFVDVWARRGLLGSDFGPEALRPTIWFLNWMSKSSSRQL